MSIQFSSTANKNGIIQLIERNVGMPDGTITNDSTLLAQFTADVNVALDRAWALIIKSAGSWHFDDNNNTDYPVMSTNLVSGQRDYSFTTDGSNNLVLEIFKINLASPSGIFQEIYPIDFEAPTVKTGNREDISTFWDGQNASGTPYRYGKLGNGIFLDPIPNYNYTSGLQLLVDREPYYFLTTDTTKKPGFAGIFHEYLALWPSSMYAIRKQLGNAKDLFTLTTSMERAIQDYYSTRQKDAPSRMAANVEQMQ